MIDTVKIRVTNAAGLYDEHTCAVTVVAAENPPTSGAIKWNPGFYITLWGSGHADTTAGRATDKSFMDQFASNANIRGFYLKKHWNVWEGSTAGNYTAGFAMVDYYLGLCRGYSNRKRLVLGMECYGVNRDPTPAYLSSYSYQPPGWTGWYLARVDQAACMDRYLAMLAAYAARYNSEPLIEVVDLGDEPSLPYPDLSIGGAFDVQYTRMLTAGKTYWPNTLTRALVSYYGNDTAACKTILQRIETLNTNGSAGCIIVGGPDHEFGLATPNSISDPGSELPAHRLWRGDSESGVSWKDVRGQMPWYAETQERGYIDPRYTQDSATNVVAYDRTTMRASHISFFDYTKWSETYAAIAAVNGQTVSTVPTCLTNRTTTTDYIKFNPGFYVGHWGGYDVNVNRGDHEDTPVNRASLESLLQTYANDTRIKGVALNRYLCTLERGTTTPLYDYAYQYGGVNYGGFAFVDWVLSKCQQYGNKRLCLHPEFIAFGGPDPLPSYWTTAGWKVTNESGKVRAMVENPACMDRFIALFQAYAARYNSHPLLEMTGSGEVTFVPAGGYTSQNAVDQWKRLMSAVVVAQPNTMFRSIQNFAPSVAHEKQLLEHAETLNNAGIGAIIVGGPDPAENPNCSYTDTDTNGYYGSWTQQLIRGRTLSGVTYKDARGQMPQFGEVQEVNYTYRVTNTAASLLNYYKNVQQATHFGFYNYNNWAETKAAVDAVNGQINTTVPTHLTGRVITGAT